MTVSTVIELLRLDQRTIEKATPEPWAISRDSDQEFWHLRSAKKNEEGTGLHIGHFDTLEDATFTLHARTRWPAALDESRRLADVVKIVCNDLETLINQILVDAVHNHKSVNTEVEEAVTVLRLARKAVENY